MAPREHARAAHCTDGACSASLPRVLDDEAATALRAALRAGRPVSDRGFDRLFPMSQRVRSYFHWTPVDVAVRASTLLAPTDDTRVLDIGAGVGKLCLIGAVITRATWIGVEIDPEMVEAANHAARLLGVADRAQFVCADASSLDWSRFDSLYFFNPFAEASRGLELQTEHLREGARIVTYHGVGGDMPSGYELVHREPAREDRLCLWVRGHTHQISRA